MAQMTIYVDDATQKAVEDAAARESVSVSRWARERLREAAAAAKPSSLKRFYGSIADEDFTEPEEIPRGKDAPRSAF